MDNSETVLWQSGITDAPLPPLIDPRNLGKASRRFVTAYRQYGPIFRLPHSVHPGKFLTVLAGPDANVFMARHEDDFFTTREHWQDFDASLTISGNSKMTDARDGAENRQRRAQSSRSYSRGRILDQLPRLVEITREFSQWSVGQSIPVVSTMQRIVAEQLGQLLLHYSIGDYLPDFVTFLDTNIMNMLGAGQRDKEALLSPEYQSARIRVQELGYAILAAHQNSTLERKPDLMDDVLAEAARNPERYSQAQLEGAAFGPLLAGLDTVANTSSFFLYALLTNPNAFARVMVDIDDLFEGEALDWERLKTKQALHGAMMETLRLYPVAGSHMALVAKPLTFAGYRLEPGDAVLVAMTVPHFLPELFSTPETFDIDRYHEPRNEHRQRGAYAPFGLGDHTCLGAGIAELQLMVIAATLLHTYQFELDPPDYQLTIKYEPTASPGKDFHIRVVA